MKIIKCKKNHIEQVVDIFWQAFSESIDFFAKPGPKLKNAFFDIFNLLLDTFSSNFLVAVDKNNQVLGYIIVVKDIKKLWIRSLKSGFIIKSLMKWIVGKYGISLKAALKVLLNKIYYIKFEVNSKNCAQFLSVAVNPQYQGRGIGKKLVKNGLEYLKNEGVNKVKLEVRPENIAARKLYKNFGFKAVDEAKDLQGKWIIMKADL